MRKFAVSIVSIGFLVGLHFDGFATESVQTGEEIVRKADGIRFPAIGFQVDVTITSTDSTQTEEVREYRILSKGNENTIVLTTAPASDRGQMMLMRGRDLWVFVPSVSQPIRLPLSQRLTGQVANGDLARANFAGDYTPTLIGEEKLGQDESYKLELKANDRGVTYAKVMYWVDKKKFRPLKAEFYTLSNRLIKVATYSDFQAMDGEQRPSKLVLEDAMKKGDRSVLVYKDMKTKDLPDKVFTKDYLNKLGNQ